MAQFLDNLGYICETLAPTYYLRKRLRLTVEDPLLPPDTRDRALEEIRLYSAVGRPMPWLIFSALLATLFVLLAQYYAAPPPPPATGTTAATGPHIHTDTAVAGLWAFAWLGGGTLLGFLFAVPRSRTTDAQAANADLAAPAAAARTASSPQAFVPPPTATAAAAASAAAPRKTSPLVVNTNLEQISDWLTKILVGVGLTQLTSFPSHLAVAARYMHAGEHAVASEALAAAIVLVFSSLGFMFGYLGTRLQLTASFLRADLWVRDSGQLSYSLSYAYVGPNPSGTIGDPAAAAAATAATALPFVAPHVAPALPAGTPPPADLAARYQAAKASLVAGQYAQAVAAYADLAALMPDNCALLREYVWALFKHGPAWSDCIAHTLRQLEAVRDKADPALRAATYASLTFHYLYAPTGTGADDVIRLATDYIQQKKGRPAAAIFINLACAYGQRFAKSANADDRNAALDAIRHALAINPASRDRLVDLLEGIAGDKDLAPFHDDPEFRQALGLPRPAPPV